MVRQGRKGTQDQPEIPQDDARSACVRTKGCEIQQCHHFREEEQEGDELSGQGLAVPIHLCRAIRETVREPPGGGVELEGSSPEGHLAEGYEEGKSAGPAVGIFSVVYWDWR